MPDQVSSVLPQPAQSIKLAYVPCRALGLIQQKCEHTPAPDPDRFPPAKRSAGARIWHSLPGEHSLGTLQQLPGAPGTPQEQASSCPQPWPEQWEFLAAVKMMLGHWQATHEP